MNRPVYSISKKAFIATLVLLIPIIAAFVVGYIFLKNHITKIVLNDLGTLSEAVEAQVYGYFESSRITVRNFATDGVIREELARIVKSPSYSHVKLSEYLEKQKRPTDKIIESIYVTDIKGRVVASTDTATIGTDASQRTFFTDAQSEAKITISNVKSKLGMPVFAFSSPVMDLSGGHKIGYITNFVLGSELSMIFSGEYLKSLGASTWGKGRGETLDVYLVSADRMLITDSRFIRDAALKQKVDTEPVAKCLTDGEEMTGIYLDYRGVEVAGSSECIKSLKWTLLVEYDTEEVFEQLLVIRWGAVALGVFVAVLTAFIYYAFYRRLAQRIEGIARGAELVSAGDLEASVIDNGHDEIRSLAESFNVMTANVRQRDRILHDSEVKYRSLVMNIPDVVWTADINGATVFISENVKSILGYPADAFYSRGEELWFGHIHPDHAAMVKKAYKALFDAGRIFAIEYKYRRSDGQWIWLFDRAISTYERNGVRCADGMFSDVTERKRTQEALIENELRLKEAQRIAKLGSWDWNVATNSLYWSDEVYGIVGLSPINFSVSYEAFLGLVHPDDRAVVSEAVSAALNGEKEYSVIHRLVRSDGEVRHVHEQGRVFRDAKGVPERMIGTVQDITSQRIAELEKESIAKFPTEAPNPILRASKDGELLYSNPVCSALFSEYGFEAGTLLPESWRAIVAQVHRDGARREEDIVYKDRVFSFIFAPIIGMDYVNIYGTDITDRKKTEFELKKISLAIDQSVNIIFITDVSGHIQYVNPMFEEITGYSKEEAIGQTPRILSSGELSHEQYDEMWTTIMAGMTWRSVYKNRKKSGGYYWCNSVISPIKNEAGEITNFLAVQEDTTEKMIADERMLFQRRHDELTGLVNRGRFMELAGEWAAMPENAGKTSAILYIDFDHFKFFNDMYGHGSGDEFLRRHSEKIVDTLDNSFRKLKKDGEAMPITGRVSGDEFIVFIPSVDAVEAMSIAEDLRAAAETFVFADSVPALTVSIGAVLYPEHGTDMRSLFTKADAATYRAKELGRNRVHKYSSDDSDIVMMHTRFKWKERIGRALAEDRFVPWYQPILHIKDGKIRHYEALARMRTEDGEIVLPGAFIDVAERFGLVGAIDRAIIEKVLIKQAAEKANGRFVSFSVNLSGKDLTDDGLLEFLKVKIKETGADPDAIIFEITETAAIGDLPSAVKFVWSLKSLGCKFSLDDFGVGFTSFTYLKELHLDYLKIDGSFIKRLHENAEDQVFVRAMVELAKGLKIQSIAEFVEKKETVELLAGFGVDYAQGYFVGKPAPEVISE